MAADVLASGTGNVRGKKPLPLSICAILVKAANMVSFVSTQAGEITSRQNLAIFLYC